MPPTNKHLRYLEAIRRLTRDGVPPTYLQIGAEVGSSAGNVCTTLHRMRERGLIDFEDGRPRSLRIVGEVETILGLPTSELRRIRDLITNELRDRFEERPISMERAMA